MRKNIVVILAGGKGTRLGGDISKQFIKIAGKMVVEHTISAFENHPLVDEIAIVSNEKDVTFFEKILLNNSFQKVRRILMGGTERYYSSLSAINAYQDVDCNLIFHDAVRPLVTERIITDCINALTKYNAIDVAIKTTDTIISTEDSFIHEIPNRDSLRNGQTPQAFYIKTIKRAYDIALRDKLFKATDDCGVVKKYLPEEKIYVVEGEGYNMKLTYMEDVFLLDKLFQLKTLQENNEKLLDTTIQQLQSKVVIVFGGSYGIGESIVKMCEENGSIVYSFSRSAGGVDISDRFAVEKAIKEVFEKEKRIDFVINTAAILSKQPLHTMSYEEIEKTININYLGAIIVAKESYPYLKESKGSILLFTSSSYTRGRSLYSIYSSSKAAIVNLVQAISDEWEDVRINCINPERTKTPMRIKNFGNEPAATLLTPEKVAVASINTLFSNFSGQVIDIKI